MAAKLYMHLITESAHSMPNFFFISGTPAVISFGSSVFAKGFLFFRFLITGFAFLILLSERAIFGHCLQSICQKYLNIELVQADSGGAGS